MLDKMVVIISLMFSSPCLLARCQCYCQQVWSVGMNPQCDSSSVSSSVADDPTVWFIVHGGWPLCFIVRGWWPHNVIYRLSVADDPTMWSIVCPWLMTPQCDLSSVADDPTVWFIVHGWWPHNVIHHPWLAMWTFCHCPVSNDHVGTMTYEEKLKK